MLELIEHKFRLGIELREDRHINIVAQFIEKFFKSPYLPAAKAVMA